MLLTMRRHALRSHVALRRVHAALRAAIMRRRVLRSCGVMRCVREGDSVLPISRGRITGPFEHLSLLVLIAFMYHRFYAHSVLFPLTLLSPFASSSHAAICFSSGASFPRSVPGCRLFILIAHAYIICVACSSTSAVPSWSATVQERLHVCLFWIEPAPWGKSLFLRAGPTSTSTTS